MNAVEYLEKLEEKRFRAEGQRTYMFGVESFIDSECAADYDPWDHASSLGIRTIYRNDLPTPQMVACYSRRHDAMFIRPNLHAAVERCAIAHEVVHFEHSDVGTTKTQEDRADRISSLRLVRPSNVERLGGVTEDPAVVAMELGVTEKVMRTYLRALRQGFRIRG